jgi:hypothetical protein
MDKDVLSPLFKIKKPIIAGDMNAHNTLWGSPNTDKLGSLIEELIEENNLSILNTGRPTYQHNNGTMTHIDLTIVASHIATKSTWDTHDNTLGSDHLPIIRVVLLSGYMFSQHHMWPFYSKFHKHDLNFCHAITVTR